MDTAHQSEREMQKQGGQYEKGGMEECEQRGRDTAQHKHCLHMNRRLERGDVGKRGRRDCPEVLHSQSTTRTDGGATTYLAECIASRHMFPISSCPKGRTRLAESVPGRPARTTLRETERLLVQLPDVDEVNSAQIIPDGPHLLSFVIRGTT